MGNENSGWRAPENGGTHGKREEIVVRPESGPIKAIVFVPADRNNEQLAKEIKEHVAKDNA